uniref:Amino acid transporter transmembrane domain-containing protein n=1 Tax=Picea sitchensis TaxID=3332 RepID=B8LNB2_PICSI|nr:unknown [Picea sitchensis]
MDDNGNHHHLHYNASEDKAGTLWTAVANILTALIGAVLFVPWGVAQLGWIAGPVAMIMFALVSWYSALLLVDCYRSPDPISGPIRNCRYRDAVQVNLGERYARLCALVQYIIFYGVCVSSTLTAAISVRAIRQSNCYHKKGHESLCHFPESIYMILYGAIQVILCQIPNFHKIWALSIVAATMSTTYATLGFCISIAKVIENGKILGSLGGITTTTSLTQAQKVWQILQGLAFGENTPGNLLAGFGFYEPYWLIDFANACIVVNMVGSYQVFCQQIFAFIEGWISHKWPSNKLINKGIQIRVPLCGLCRVNILRVCWRIAFVVSTTYIAILFPLFNAVLGILGAVNFWPLVVYFPVEMHIVRNKIPRWTLKWSLLQTLSFISFLVSVVTAAGSIEGLVKDKIT